MDRDDLILFYFNLGFNHRDILASIALRAFILNKRHLKRIVKTRGFFHCKYSELQEVIDFIAEALGDFMVRGMLSVWNMAFK